MWILINWLLSTVAILLAAYFLPGVTIANFQTAFIAALILGVINAVVKPILFFLTLPITFLTLGLFTFVINALMIMLTSALVPGFHVDNFLWALIFSVVLSVISTILHQIIK